MRRDDFRFFHPLRVRWAEVDRQDIVFNGHYLTYFDVAITEYWRVIGLRYPEDLAASGTDVFAVRSATDYLAPAAFDDVLDVGCRVARIGRSSLRFELGIWRGDEHLTKGELVYVHALASEKKSQPWPERLVRLVVDFERTPPERG
jgi:acyl-CoA thioester hydrolase